MRTLPRKTIAHSESYRLGSEPSAAEQPIQAAPTLRARRKSGGTGRQASRKEPRLRLSVTPHRPIFPEVEPTSLGRGLFHPNLCTIPCEGVGQSGDGLGDESLRKLLQ